MAKAIVLFSGGLDSTACLYWAKKHYNNLILMSFLYGSKEDKVIEKTNKHFASLLSVESKIIHLPFLSDFTQDSGSTLASTANGLPEFTNEKDLDDLQITENSASAVWVPGRNLLFLSIASSAADSFKEPAVILFGGNEEEGTTFPDNTSEFINRMNKAIKLGCANDIRILTPFINKDKIQIAQFLEEEQVPYEFSSSCYQVKTWTDDGLPIHCGKCESCSRRNRAFKRLGVKDKTIYKN